MSTLFIGPLLIAAGALIYLGASYRGRKKVTLPVTADARFCRECRNFLPERIPPFGLRRGIEFGRCSHPTAMREVPDFLVRGYLHEGNMGYASIQRSRCDTILRFLPAGSLVGVEVSEAMACGPQGRYWEKKDTA